MQTIALATFNGDWRALVQQVERSGVPVALELDGQICGVLLPSNEASSAATRYDDLAQARVQQQELAEELPATADGDLKNYLELLRDDRSLVPVVDGQPLEFETMMNSSYVDPEQMYQFRNPRTGEVRVYRASELRRAIRKQFANVEFVPDNPRAFVEGNA